MSVIDLSIIIPIYNSAAYLAECLESVLAIGLSGYELLLIDDGSSDESVSIARHFCEKRSYIRLYEQKNSGPSAARNLGLMLAKGEYVCFVDSDDRIDSAAFTKSFEKLKQCQSELLVSDFYRSADNGVILDNVFQIDATPEPIVEREYLTRFVSVKDCVWNVWRYIYKTSFLREHSLRFAEGYNCAEDVDFTVRVLMQCSDIAFFHEPYYYYRVNYGQSLTRRCTAERVQDMNAMLKRAWLCLDEYNEEAAVLLQGKISREYLLAFSLYYESPKAERAEIIKSFEKHRFLMKTASGVLYKLIAALAECFGIRSVAFLLLIMKRVKRMGRGIKVRCCNGY